MSLNTYFLGILIVMSLTGCQTTSNKQAASTSSISRTVSPNLDICTQEGRNRVNKLPEPPKIDVTSNSFHRRQRDYHIEIGDYYYQNHLILLQAAKQCPNADKKLLQQLAAGQLSFANQFYGYANEATYEINQRKRRQGENIAAILGGIAGAASTIALTNSQSSVQNSGATGTMQCRPVDATCRTGDAKCLALPRCP